MAAEGLGELGGLAVPNAARDIADRHAAGLEQLEGTLHAYLGHVTAETGVSDFCEGPLELAPRRRKTSCHLVELEILWILALDDLLGLLK